ncbi:MAG: bifunctional UDP-3-O-[3-hydroxymyristoyl] N-acetylglucosamine deacetylase/3-hydroxyacyl-ACP dehydratase [Candidatus Glassbacteria bacterium]
MKRKDESAIDEVGILIEKEVKEMRQRTIAKEVGISGKGLHTGNECHLVFKPAPADTGIVFIRMDIDGAPAVPALVEHVSDVERGTTISADDVEIHTVEHVLAAITSMGINNIIVGLNANEPPVGDGSALSFVEKLDEAGFKEQDARRKVLKIEKPFYYSEDGVNFLILPNDNFKVSFYIDYENPNVGSQFASVVINRSNFKNELAPARTFCFVEDIEALKTDGLIKGGTLENAVVIGREGILNQDPLRFHNEFVRHKIVDLIGDLSLLGSDLIAHVISSKSGHPSNIELVRRLKKLSAGAGVDITRGKKIRSLDIVEIQKILPHRYPFLLVDRILELEEGKRAIGVKNVTHNEFFFQGHFPGHPVMPGVLCIEAMGQVGGVLLMNSVPDPENKVVYFISLDKVKFRKPVRPGDVLKFELTMMKIRGKTCKMSGKAFVKKELVAEAEMVAMIVDK